MIKTIKGKNDGTVETVDYDEFDFPYYETYKAQLDAMDQAGINRVVIRLEEGLTIFYERTAAK